MRPHERRLAGATTYYKLSAWDPRFGVWKAGKKAFPSEAEARASARPAGRYRVCRVTEAGHEELPAFEV